MKGGKLAVFDFDGTLVSFDTTRLYLALLALCSPLKTIFSLLKRRCKSEPLSSFLVQKILSNQSESKFSTVIAVYRFIVLKYMGGDALEALRFYSSQSDWNVLVATASPAFLVRPIMKGIPIIAHEYKISNGRFTGGEVAPRPLGAEKLSQVLSWAGREGIRGVSVVYSDSMADAPLLGAAREAYLVKNGKATLVKNIKAELAQ